MDGVKVWYFPAGRPRRIFRSPALGKALARMLPKFDLVHLHSVFLWPTWAAAVECRKHGVPYFVSPRGMMVKELVQRKSPLVKSAWIRLIERTNLEHAAAVHVTADIEAAELEKFGFSLPPVINIPNGVAKPSNVADDSINTDVQKLCARQPLRVCPKTSGGCGMVMVKSSLGGRERSEHAVIEDDPGPARQALDGLSSKVMPLHG